MNKTPKVLSKDIRNLAIIGIASLIVLGLLSESNFTIILIMCAAFLAAVYVFARSPEPTISPDELTKLKQKIREKEAAIKVIKPKALDNQIAVQKADFLANASHELKTPIASILGYIETLRGHAKDDPAAQEKFLGIMQDQAERMQRLITDILSLRKIEQHEHIIPTAVADLGLAVQAALEAVHPIAQSRNVGVNYLGASEDVLVKGSQDELVQLVLNLVDNAVRMSSSNSVVRLNLDKSSKGQEFTDDVFDKEGERETIVDAPRSGVVYWRLRITDSGPGFKPEHLPRLGERFYRIAGDRSSSEKGTGLGLAIVKHIIRWHRGGLYIESLRGTGTEFIILLPVTISENENAPIETNIESVTKAS